jgi:predicted RNA binding protein YcfA (HicA-like mRNA interferase family)
MKVREVITILERAGWHRDHTTGSHYLMRHPDKPRLVPVPFHGDRDIKIGVLRSIIRQAGMTVDEFLASE